MKIPIRVLAASILAINIKMLNGGRRFQGRMMNKKVGTRGGSLFITAMTEPEFNAE